MEVDIDYFESFFLMLKIKIIKIERYILSKYVLLSLNDSEFLLDSRQQKAYNDLKKFYAKILKSYKNFEITKDHQDNMDRILKLGKSNFENGGKTIMMALYRFLFKTKNYTKIKESKDQKQDESIDKEGKGKVELIGKTTTHRRARIARIEMSQIRYPIQGRIRRN
jgi:hypothetical protein